MTAKFTVSRSIAGITLTAEVTIDERGIARFNFSKTNGVPSAEDVIEYKIDKLPGFNRVATDNAREVDAGRFRALLAEHRNRARETAIAGSTIFTVSKLFAESGPMAGVIHSSEVTIDERGVARFNSGTKSVPSAEEVIEFEIDELPGFSFAATDKAREADERRFRAIVAERRIKEAASGETSVIEIEGRSVKRIKRKHS